MERGQHFNHDRTSRFRKLYTDAGFSLGDQDQIARVAKEISLTSGYLAKILQGKVPPSEGLIRDLSLRVNSRESPLRGEFQNPFYRAKFDGKRPGSN